MRAGLEAEGRPHSTKASEAGFAEISKGKGSAHVCLGLLSMRANDG